MASTKSGRIIPRPIRFFSVSRLKSMLVCRFLITSPPKQNRKQGKKTEEKGSARMTCMRGMLFMELKRMFTHGCDLESRRQPKDSPKARSPIMSKVAHSYHLVKFNGLVPLSPFSRSLCMNRSMYSLMNGCCSTMARAEKAWAKIRRNGPCLSRLAEMRL